MKIFLDTSALIKLYFREQGTEDVDLLFAKNNIEAVFISELSKIEFASAIWKKVRLREMTSAQGLTLIRGFLSDIDRYDLIPIDQQVVESALTLINRHGESGLRSLDAIQLACAIRVKKEVSVAKTFDLLLLGLFKKEGLRCD